MATLTSAIAESAGRPDTLALLFLNLDRFTVINDSLGHDTGDLLLTAAGERLAAAIPPNGSAARFGGDEFAVLLPHITAANDAMLLAERLLRTLAEPFTLNGQEVFISASAGVAVNPDPPMSADELLQSADVALNQAKKAGKARATLFNHERTEKRAKRLALESDLWRAVERNELLLHYQPIVNLSSGQIVGMEALVRWQHPRLGMVSPAEFIPLAEENGVILSVGRWVLEQACRQLWQWQARHARGPRLVMSVNLSAKEFQHPDLIRQVAQVLRECGLHPASLKLEITETALMLDAASTVETLHALKRLGVLLALDDFGTGYSSLNYLRRFPVDTLKIDRSFVKELGNSTESLAIVRALVALAHALNMDVTAEGFETSTQLARLRDAYCDSGQGFYFSKPLPVEEMTALLASLLG